MIARHRSRPTSRRTERGVALLPLVFSAAIVMIAAVSAYLEASSRTYQLAQFRSDRARALYLAEGAVELAIGALEDGDVAKEIEGKAVLSEGEASFVLAPMDQAVIDAVGTAVEKVSWGQIKAGLK